MDRYEIVPQSFIYQKKVEIDFGCYCPIHLGIGGQKSRIFLFPEQ